MISKFLRSNVLALGYDMLSEEGKNLSKTQRFDFIPEDGTPEELYAIATDIKSILVSAPKVIRQDLSYDLIEM
ncbi:MAG: hypothetical protein FWC47_03840 [Oscillospiraceae bacterium]|nr:hypothetical protein [Oscillospiraceae bacterium]